MSKGIIFDIKEFSIHDGPGPRITVFMKGCPLRCLWCHNPEGISSLPQPNMQNGQVVGEEWSAAELVERIMRYKDYFDAFGGGVTFSGGEPTLQAAFLIACAEKLNGIHKLLDTSGYCARKIFAEVARRFDAFYYDIKFADTALHQQYTGVTNEDIIANLRFLMDIRADVTLRMPMIPGITDTESALSSAAELIGNLCPSGTPIHLLPYNALAEGKYSVYGMEYPLHSGYRQNHISKINDFQAEMSMRGYRVTNYC